MDKGKDSSHDDNIYFQQPKGTSTPTKYDWKIAEEVNKLEERIRLGCGFSEGGRGIDVVDEEVRKETKEEKVRKGIGIGIGIGEEAMDLGEILELGSERAVLELEKYEKDLSNEGKEKLRRDKERKAKDE